MNTLCEIWRWVQIIVLSVLMVYAFLNACGLEPHFGTGHFLRSLFGLVGMGPNSSTP